MQGANYVWRNNSSGTEVGKGTAVMVSPHKTTTYEVEMSTADGCLAYDIITINVDASTIPCGCPGPTFDKEVLTQNKIIENENIVIKDKLTVPANVTLVIKESGVNFQKDAILEVLPGGRLEIINSDLRSCNSLEHWKFIRVRGNNQDKDQLKISGSTISDAITGVAMELVRGGSIKGNTFNGGTAGIDMSNSKEFTITENSFINNDIGIKTNNGVAGTSLIEGNTFQGNKTAIRFNFDNHSDLTLNCNTFNSYTDYAIYSNKATLKDQGSAALGAGNTFVTSSTKMNNRLFHNGATMKYFYDPSSPFSLNTSNTLSAIALSSQTDNGCQSTGARTQASTTAEKNIIIERQSALLGNIPNPSNGKTTILYQLSSENAKKPEIKISDMLGQVLASYSISAESNRLEVNLSHLPSGIYFYSLTDYEQVIAIKRMIITK